MNLLAERFVFGGDDRVFWTMGSTYQKVPMSRLNFQKLLFCLHMYSLCDGQT